MSVTGSETGISETFNRNKALAGMEKAFEFIS
jgi:hypothetical protein